MKAKEHIISGTIVIFCGLIFALSFVACGSKSSGNPSSPDIPPVYAITLDPAGNHDFGSLQQGYTHSTRPSHNVTVSILARMLPAN